MRLLIEVQPKKQEIHLKQPSSNLTLNLQRAYCTFGDALMEQCLMRKLCLHTLFCPNGSKPTQIKFDKFLENLSRSRKKLENNQICRKLLKKMMSFSTTVSFPSWSIPNNMVEKMYWGVT